MQVRRQRCESRTLRGQEDERFTFLFPAEPLPQTLWSKVFATSPRQPRHLMIDPHSSSPISPPLLGAKWKHLRGSGGHLGAMFAHLSSKLAVTTQGYQHDAQDAQRWPQDPHHRPQILDFGRILGFMLAPKIDKKPTSILKS